MKKRKKLGRHPHIGRLLQPSGVLGQSRLVSRKWSIVLPILCAPIFLKGTSSLSGLLMVLVFGLVHIFELKAATQCFDRFLKAHVAFFFEGSFISDCIFFSVSSARDAQIIFRSLAIILLDVLAIGFLLFAHHCSLFAVR